MRDPSTLAKLALGALALTWLACAGSSDSPWTTASPDPAVININPVSYAEGSGVTPAVRAECGLEHNIPEKIARHAQVPVVLTDEASGARTLTIEISYIVAPEGREASGSKSVTLDGELVEDGAVIGSFEARRTIDRGGGNCDVLNAVSDALGQDIAPWLASPRLDAKLGEA